MSATVPASRASVASSNWIPPGPSSPSSMPRPRNTSSVGAPRRSTKLAAIEPTRSTAIAMMSGSGMCSRALLPVSLSAHDARHGAARPVRAGRARARSTSLPAMSEHPVVDVTIIGAGPAGLAAAYYAGHREASCRIIESLEQLGGQVAAVYPEKHIFDIAGFPKINGQEYVDRMVEQGLQYGAEALLGEAVETLERVEGDGEELWSITTDKGGPYLTRTVIITAGHGAFEPRTLPIEGLEEWRGRGLHYFVKRKADFAGKRCVIVGGGDSALDWTINLQDTADGPDPRRAPARPLPRPRVVADRGARARRGRRRPCCTRPARCARCTAATSSSASRSRTPRAASSSRSTATR